MMTTGLIKTTSGNQLLAITLGHSLLDDYLEFVAARARPNTLLAAAYDLKVFFTEVVKQPADVSTADVLGFIKSQRAPRRGPRVVRLEDGEAGLSARTIKRRLASVSGLFDYLAARGDAGVATNPVPRGLATRGRRGRPGVRGVPLIRAPRTLPRVLEPADAEAFLTALRAHRDRAMAQAMLLGGLRRCEVLGLRLPDLRPGERRVFVAEGKGGRQRIVPVSARFFATVAAYYDTERPRTCGTDHPTITTTAADGTRQTIENPNFGSATSLLLAVLTLIITLAIARFAPGFWSRIAVLLGLVIGTLIATVMGKVNWGAVGRGAIFEFPQPFFFGAPKFAIGVIISLCIVVLVIMAETTADLLAVGRSSAPTSTRSGSRPACAPTWAPRPSPRSSTASRSAPSPNVGMVALTGIKSRFVVAAGGGILVVLGLMPVLGRVMNAIPQPVLGGAGIVLFGSVAAAGIRTLSRVNFTNSNVLIVAASIGVGIIPITVPEVYNHLPEWLATIFESGISATGIFAVLLNLAFNHFSKTDEPVAAEH